MKINIHEKTISWWKLFHFARSNKHFLKHTKIGCNMSPATERANNGGLITVRLHDCHVSARNNKGLLRGSNFPGILQGVAPWWNKRLFQIIWYVPRIQRIYYLCLCCDIVMHYYININTKNTKLICTNICTAVYVLSPATHRLPWNQLLSC